MPKRSPKQIAAWQHNAFFGHVRMDMAHMRMIMHSATATPEAISIANEIYTKLGDLQKALKERKPL